MLSRNQNLIVLGTVLLIELGVLAYQVHRNRDISLLRQTSMLVVTPVERGIRATTDGTVRLWREYLDLRSTRRENQQLVNELNAVKLENQRLEDQAAQAKRLAALLQFKEQVPSEVVAARVISSGGSENARLVGLDKGQESGLKPDMAAMTPDGIVGKVLRVFPFASQVLLLTDSNSGVACLLENSRTQGILRGQGKDLGILTYVPNDEKVEIGERVFTSGEDQIYPKGLPVGVVVEVHPGPSFMEIKVQPFAKMNRLEEVLVVTKKTDVEIPGSPTTGQTVAGFSQATSESEQKPESKPETKTEPKSAAVRKPGLFVPSDRTPAAMPTSPAPLQPAPSTQPQPNPTPRSQ